MLAAGRFPWARPRYELLLLALVAVSALSPVIYPNTQDASRICLAEAMIHGSLSNNDCFRQTTDHARYHGRLYSDKAPGLSVLEIPAVAALSPGERPAKWPLYDLRLWGIRLATVGVLFLAGAFLLGRVSEGIAPGFGGVALVTFALGTLYGPLAQVSFDHVPAATLGFGAFLLAWRRRPGLAGLAAGALFLVEYESAFTVVAIGVYVALLGWRSLYRYLYGLVPAGLLLAAYNWAAFGAPWHMSYHYVANVYAADQQSGFFGIALPHRFSVYEVFAGNDGLLVLSPVLVLAAYGLVRLGRSYRAEAILAGAVAAILIFINCGYFLPLGGGSPGPRFLAAGLPFLCLGLSSAFAWRPRLTLALAAYSVAAMSAENLIWISGHWMPQTVWGGLLRIVSQGGSSAFVESLSPNIVSELGIGRQTAAVIVGVSALAALGLAGWEIPWRRFAFARRPLPWRIASRRTALVTCILVSAVAAADASAVLAVPYGQTFGFPSTPLFTTITASSRSSYVGGEVNFVVTLRNDSNGNVWDVLLTLQLSRGMRLVGPPHYTRGFGCTGTQTVVCNLDYLSAFLSTSVDLGVQMTQYRDQLLIAQGSSDGVMGRNTAHYPISIGGLGCWQCSGTPP